MSFYAVLSTGYLFSAAQLATANDVNKPLATYIDFFGAASPGGIDKNVLILERCIDGTNETVTTYRLYKHVSFL